MNLSEIVILAFIALLLYGPEDFPVIARALGKVIGQVRRYTSELSKEFQDAWETPGNVINQAFKETSADNDKSQLNEKPEDSEELLQYEKTITTATSNEKMES